MSLSGASRLIERDLAGEALIDEPVEAFPFTPCYRLASCQGEIVAGIIACLCVGTQPRPLIHCAYCACAVDAAITAPTASIVVRMALGIGCLLAGLNDWDAERSYSIRIAALTPPKPSVHLPNLSVRRARDA